MYIIRGYNKNTGKYWYQLKVNETKDENGKKVVTNTATIFISEKIYESLKSCGIKVYEKSFNEVA